MVRQVPVRANEVKPNREKSELISEPPSWVPGLLNLVVYPSSGKCYQDSLDKKASQRAQGLLKSDRPRRSRIRTDKMPLCSGASEYRSYHQRRQNSLIHGCFSKAAPDSSSMYCKCRAVSGGRELGFNLGPFAAENHELGKN